MRLVYFKLSFFGLLFAMPSVIASNTRGLFLDWLGHADEKVAEEIMNSATQDFRQRFGFYKSRYSDRLKKNWSPEFLAIVDDSFKEKMGASISDFCAETNRQIKEGISTSLSRYSPDQNEFSEIFSQYLKTNLSLLKQKKVLSITEANKEIWKGYSKIAALESMGGNAGTGAVAVNFLFDRSGRIVFVGNIQDAEPEIKKQHELGRLSDGTVRYAVDTKIYQLHLQEKIAPELKKRLTQDLSEYHGAAPQTSTGTFNLQCELALKRLWAR